MAPAGDHNKPAGALLCPCLTKQGHFHSEPSEPSQPLYRAHIAIPPPRTHRKAWGTAFCGEQRYSRRGGTGMSQTE